MLIDDPVITEFVSDPNFEPLRSYPFYFTIAFAAAAIPASTTFFQDSTGQNNRTLLDTNMLIGSSITAPEKFLITSFNVHYGINTIGAGNDSFTQVDMQNFHNSVKGMHENCVFQLTVNGGNEVLTTPLWMIPGGNGLDGYIQTSTGTGTAADQGAGFTTNGAPIVGNAYPFMYPLESKMNFAVLITAPGAAQTLTAAIRVTIVMNGIRFRSRQR